MSGSPESDAATRRSHFPRYETLAPAFSLDQHNPQEVPGREVLSGGGPSQNFSYVDPHISPVVPASIPPGVGELPGECGWSGEESSQSTFPWLICPPVAPPQFGRMVPGPIGHSLRSFPLFCPQHSRRKERATSSKNLDILKNLGVRPTKSIFISLYI